jgi:hypothetical protein
VSKKLLICIDIAGLGTNMSKEEGRQLSDDEIRQWLVEAGFAPSGDRWLVEERDLGQLDPAEVKSVEDAPAE